MDISFRLFINGHLVLCFSSQTVSLFLHMYCHPQLLWIYIPYYRSFRQQPSLNTRYFTKYRWRLSNPLISLVSPVLSRIDIPRSSRRHFRFINTRHRPFSEGSADDYILDYRSLVVFKQRPHIPISHAVPVRAANRAITHERSAFSCVPASIHLRQPLARKALSEPRCISVALGAQCGPL